MNRRSDSDLPRARIAADVGGTFTDVVAFDEVSGVPVTVRH